MVKKYEYKKNSFAYFMHFGSIVVQPTFSQIIVVYNIGLKFKMSKKEYFLVKCRTNQLGNI